MATEETAHQAIQNYYAEVEKIVRFGGSKKETAVRNAFLNLLNAYAGQQGLVLVPEISIKLPDGKTITPDGTLKDSLTLDWGHWESKDEYDDLDKEIAKKFDKGYPKENILFEDGQTAVLIQSGKERSRVSIKDAGALHQTLVEFIRFERPDVQNFRRAIELFAQDVPTVTEALRAKIDDADKTNETFKRAASDFLSLCQKSVNTRVTQGDVKEMIIQHILTEDIFNTIFDENQFHRENNIARELEKVIATFFTGADKKTVMNSIRQYYQAINATAARIADHHEKQKFLKVVYETFYKSYNPKAADRLGVVYTPREIVKFMIESADYLLHKHFNKYLEDKNVEILDPATGTGTFICDIIDYIRAEKLEYKYKNEIHANEVAILPYYISNLNIEYIYTQKMGKYVEFENLCFVDTLDNTERNYKGQGSMNFITEENSERIKRQNSKKIAVIIGNPPYNANQANENDNNKNREYPHIDERIKNTFVKCSTAQKTKVYDMYARFLRWAMDRIDENGIIAFVSNNSFINSKTFDGFRQILSKEFNCAYVINLKGNARTSGELRRKEGGNVFHDQIKVGIAIYFLIKKKSIEGFEVYYDEVKDYFKAEEKLQWLAQNPLKNVSFEIIRPDKNNNWINIADNDFESLLPLYNKRAKKEKNKGAVFELLSLGVVTARDEWVYDFDAKTLANKVRFLVDLYNSENALKKGRNANKIKDVIDYSIKWTRGLKNGLAKGNKLLFSSKEVREGLYRPFVKKQLYFNKDLNEMQSLSTSLFGGENLLITFSLSSSSKPFHTIAANCLADYHLAGDAGCLPLYRYNVQGNRIDNITNWGLKQFREHYKDERITKESIFYYVYAVLHNPAYRKKYELNLKREFPRIPFYRDFHRWSAWGEQLMNLHINYEKVEPYDLEIESSNKKDFPKAKLKADKENGIIVLDENDSLIGVPKEAWDYKLGNRSALEWILDQYREKTPKDPTIAEKFNTYRFADYKEQVIDLLKRVCAVSVETVKIVSAMEKENQ
jgi:predicted helicase